MQKLILLLFFFLLNGCTFNNLFIGGEIDKVTVVKYTPYMKHHRAYFSRTQLKTMRDGKKYLFLYNAKNNDVGVLLHRKSQYVLYNMSNPDQQPMAVNANKKTKYWHALKSFKHKGFKRIKSLASVGYTASVSHKRYKGRKTLLIETKEYSRLLKLYKKAIKTYNASRIKNIKTKLPKSLIYSYYKQYEKRANSRKQRMQLKIIANKLQIKAPYIIEKKPKQTKVTTKQPASHKKKPAKEKIITGTSMTKKEEPVIQKEEPETPLVKKVSLPTPSSDKPYTYYLHQASLDELSTYIANKATKNSLSYNQYTMLRHRKSSLQEEKLFKEGSLEELIAAYKVNKNPKYKKRIMSLMKAKQESH
ncbi:MAG TPA: hypothetical protein ENK90_00950 [Epsilonproteobacteria bacterium]|nr:hypothetical protein [Campylobacterota bacterium]HHD79213.1 hypothetical protein [Campylobacterota bacterium]HHE05674.1 hypothetical protein [Campylobacterota bacterium]